jgi:hypothetical protein
MNFLLDGRWNDYEVLTEMPIGLRTLARHVHREGNQIIVVGPSYFSEPVVQLHAIGAPSQVGMPVPIQMLAGSQMVERLPHLKKQINEQWGFGSSYFVLAALSPGEDYWSPSLGRKTCLVLCPESLQRSRTMIGLSRLLDLIWLALRGNGTNTDFVVVYAALGVEDQQSSECTGWRSGWFTCSPMALAG